MRTLKTQNGVTVKIATTPQDMERIMSFIEKLPSDQIVALDFETTGLFPRPADDPEQHQGPRVRTTNLSWRPDVAYVLDHDYCGTFYSVVDRLIAARPQYYVFYAPFEMNWFDTFGDEDDSVELFDIANMRKSVMGGGPYSLKKMVKMDLKIDMPKEEQLSDWSDPNLTNRQYLYAGMDAIYTYRIAAKWETEMTQEHWSGFHILNGCTRAFIEMERTGFLLNVEYHQSLIDMWGKRREAAERCLRRFTDVKALPNLRSKIQISNLLKANLDDASVAAWPKTAKTQQMQTSRAILRQASFRAPYPLSRWLAALMVFNRSDKYLGTYGEKLINAQRLAGRIYPRYNIAQAITGRVSSSGAMNAQNLPHSYAVRKSFIAGAGMKLIVADYSGVEIRVLAEVSGDEQLKQDCIYGDVHSESAVTMFGFDHDKFFEAIKNKEGWAKDLRGKAKGFTFQLLYGAGNGALAMVLRCTDEEAGDFVRAWARRYPKAYAYRTLMYEKMKSTGFLPVVSGRTIFVFRSERTMPVASNYPIQGAAADVMYRACTRVQSMLEQSGLSAWLQSTVHDELLVLAEENVVEEVKELLERGMREAWLDVFPGTVTHNLVEAGAGDTWAEAK